MATAEVQISETETPLHRLETVYRRLCERLATATDPPSALRPGRSTRWLYALEEDVLAEGVVSTRRRRRARPRPSTRCWSERLAALAPDHPRLRRRPARLPACARLTATPPRPTASSPGSAASRTSPRRPAGRPGSAATSTTSPRSGFLQGLLTVLRDSGHPGLVLVLDEVETLQRVRSDVREQGAQRAAPAVDEVDAGRFPGLYLVITGTPAFFDGRQGVARLPPLAAAAAHRLRHRRPVRQPAGAADPAARLRPRPARRARRARPRPVRRAAPMRRSGCGRWSTTPTSPTLARAVAGELGGQVGVAPRLFLRKLVGDVLDRVDQFADFDPRRALPR